MIKKLRSMLPFLVACLFVGLFSTSVYAAKKERVFVGNSTDLFEEPLPFLVALGADLCRDTFGEGATIANSRQIRAAIDDGTISLLTGLSWFLPSDVVAADAFLYDENVGLYITQDQVFTIQEDGLINRRSSTGVLKAVACVQ